jgi:RNA polymerase sigma factor (sigma-70 family)
MDNEAKSAGDLGPQRRIESADLYDLCLKRDEEGWRLLYTECLKRARYNKCQDAEDVAQEVCMKLLDKMESLHIPPAKFLAYARRMVSNEIITRYRRARVRSEVPMEYGDDGMAHTETKEIAENALAGAFPELNVMAWEVLDRLAEVMEDLPPHCRKVVNLTVRYRVGLIESYKEMAAMLGISVGGLSGQINKCMKRLGQLLTPEMA